MLLVVVVVVVEVTGRVTWYIVVFPFEVLDDGRFQSFKSGPIKSVTELTTS